MRDSVPLNSVAIAIVVATLGFASVTQAMSGKCDHDCSSSDTIESLSKCVEHAAKMGHIDNRGVANALLRKLDFAWDAYDQGDLNLAENLLDAFINHVSAQAGKHIVSKCANHMIAHAVDVIDGL